MPLPQATTPNGGCRTKHAGDEVPGLRLVHLWMAGAAAQSGADAAGHELVGGDLPGDGLGDHDWLSVGGVLGGLGAERHARELGDPDPDRLFGRSRGEQRRELAAVRADLARHVLDPAEDDGRAPLQLMQQPVGVTVGDLMVMGMARVAPAAPSRQRNGCPAVHPARYGYHNTGCTYPDNLFNGPILDLSAQQRHPFHIEWPA